MLTIEDDEFKTIRELVRSSAGIHLNESKRSLVVARLAKRLRSFGYGTFREYCEHLATDDPAGHELREAINCITTNKTEFFREGHHFEFLRTRVIPELRARAVALRTRKIRIWSAGCSTGQEPYSIAMVLADELRLGGWDIRILASDIDTNVLSQAEAGEYAAKATLEIPEPMRSAAFERNGSRVRVTKALRDMVTFRHINLIEEPWPIRAQFDAIFCRNVTIYFDRETQARLYRRLASHLSPDGYLFAGHSENLHWLGDLFAPMGNTVYSAVATSERKGKSHTRSPHEIAIQSGGVYASAEPSVVRTVLGSCVSACLFDPEGRIGGMNHFMLADGSGDGVPSTRYGVHAMKVLIAAITKHGGQRSRLRAKIFGGAHVLQLQGSSGEVAADNARFVRQFLADQQIPIVAERIGGELPMQVRFETNTGRAFARTVRVARQEAGIREALAARTHRSEKTPRLTEESQR